MISYTAAVLLAVLSTSLACSPTWPNATDTTPTWFQCNSGPITFYNATPFDENGKYEYPVHLSKPLTIKADINNPKTTYGSPGLKQTTNIWSWTTTCNWSPVPTFGMLKNLDACSNGIPCPIKTGRQELDILMDFSPYGAIIALLKDDAPYQLQMILHDDVTKADVGCITFQARARIQ
uniref:ML domain-containing protein n=1 Tax=Haemonchus contortus TaxID=6289 RepID=A0A7I5E8F7_HAECO